MQALALTLCEAPDQLSRSLLCEAPRLPPPDASILVSVDELERSGLPFALAEHPYPGGNILFELQRAQEQRRYLLQNEQMIRFISRELEQGGSLTRATLYQGGTILRNMTMAETTSFGEEWYRKTLECGIQDQIPLNFVTEGFEFATLKKWY